MTPKLAVVDVSHWQRDYLKSFAPLVGQGVVGVICKATEGIAGVDDLYDHWRPQIETAGLLHGAYHFSHSKMNPAAQARHFVAHAKPTDKTLLALDWEGVTAAAAFSAAEARAFLEALMVLTGRKPEDIWIYGGNAPREKIMAADRAFFGQFRNWHCQYGTPYPRVSAAWPTFELWQYSQTGRIPGINGNFDFSTYAGGDDAKLKRAWAPGYRGVVVPIRPQPVPVPAPAPAINPTPTAPVQNLPKPAQPAAAPTLGSRIWDWLKRN